MSWYKLREQKMVEEGKKKNHISRCNIKGHIN